MSGDAAPAGSALVQPAVLLRLARQGVRHHLADGPAEAAEGQAHRRSTSSPQQSARRSWAPGRAGPIWTCETPPSSGLLGASGLRRAELLAMRRGDLDGRDSAPVRRGKGGKSRVVAFDAETSIAIRPGSAFRSATWLTNASSKEDREPRGDREPALRI